MPSDKKETKLITGECIASYANVWEPKIDDNGNAKYGISLVIPKSDTETINAVKQATANVLTNKFGDKKNWPKKFKTPLRDGDEEKEDEVYANSMFFNANSKNMPGIVDERVQPIMNQQDFYSGCICRASVNFFWFDTKGNKGVAAGLNNLMKVRDGERIGGGAKAEEDFADFAKADNVDDNDLPF